MLFTHTVTEALFILRVGKVPWSDVAYSVRLKGPWRQPTGEKAVALRGISHLLTLGAPDPCAMQLHGLPLLRMTLRVLMHAYTHIPFVYLRTTTTYWHGHIDWKPTPYNAYTRIFILNFEVAFVLGM